jgi:PTH1 family peptidyl-tRNA hydrolase
MEKLGTDAFKRVRIGIGRPEDRSPDVVADFVLNKFLPAEIATLEETVYPLVAPGQGLQTLCVRGELWRPVKEKQQKQQKQQPSPKLESVDLPPTPLDIKVQ